MAPAISLPFRSGTDNIRGFETELSENKGPSKPALRENETTLIENRPTPIFCFESSP
jgi:hypothetical protein